MQILPEYLRKPGSAGFPPIHGHPPHLTSPHPPTEAVFELSGFESFFLLLDHLWDTISPSELQKVSLGLPDPGRSHLLRAEGVAVVRKFVL